MKYEEGKKETTGFYLTVCLCSCCLPVATARDDCVCGQRVDDEEGEGAAAALEQWPTNPCLRTPTLTKAPQLWRGAKVLGHRPAQPRGEAESHLDPYWGKEGTPNEGLDGRRGDARLSQRQSDRQHLNSHWSSSRLAGSSSSSWAVVSPRISRSKVTHEITGRKQKMRD
jgi:hypothetical protein